MRRALPLLIARLSRPIGGAAASIAEERLRVLMAQRAQDGRMGAADRAADLSGALTAHGALNDVRELARCETA